MWKKRMLCLVLVLCAALTMTACQQKETFPTTAQQPQAAQQQQAAQQPAQNIFGDTPVPEVIRAKKGECDYRDQYLEFDLPAYGGLVFEFMY